MRKKIAVLVTASLMILGACGGSSSTSNTAADGAAQPTTTVAAATGGDSSGTYKADKGTVAQVALATPGFTSLVAAVLAAGLLTTLSGDGPFTVFAPTDAAFAKLPKQLVDKLFLPKNSAVLAKILTYHVVPGKLMKSDLTGSIATVEGQKVAFSGGGSKVNDSTIATADVLADNGVIHVIDSVLVPPDLNVGAL